MDIRVYGTWCHRGKWEIYILSIISEIYNRRTYPDLNYERDAAGSVKRWR